MTAVTSLTFDKETQLPIRRYIEVGEVKTRLTDKLAMDYKILLLDYIPLTDVIDEVEENEQPTDILNSLEVKLIVLNKETDTVQDYLLQTYHVGDNNDMYVVRLYKGNIAREDKEVYMDDYDSCGSQYQGNELQLEAEFGSAWEDVFDLIGDILFTYVVKDEEVEMGLINPF